MAGILNKIRTTLEMIKWEHSIFALPFALTAMLLAAGGLPSWRTVAWIVVAMVAARSAAMAFNRWADADLDAANPRTKNRAIPAGSLTRKFVLGFTCVAVAVFLIAAGELNRLTLELAPLALAVLLGYSYLKRFTRWSHLGLGLALGLAPTAAAALWALAWFAWLFHFELAGWLGIAAVGLLLGYEHALVSPRDLRRLNAAFFTMNGVIAIVFLGFVSADLWFKR
ncbi:MAG: UbiA family prenyltransferase [Terracidiphilus sp.]